MTLDFRLLTIPYATLLAGVSLLPSGAELPERLASWDAFLNDSVQNALHMPAYAILAVLALATTTRRHQATGLRTGMTAIALCWVYGASLEYLQAFIPGRTGSLSDLLCNSAGVAFGAAAWFALARWRSPRTSDTKRATQAG